MGVETTLLHGAKVSLQAAFDALRQIDHGYWHYDCDLISEVIVTIDSRLEELRVDSE
jgi:hypothetical protein